ncbi:hypothetical protein G3A43_07385 [Paraburkholderia aspalathi]|nr:hypothetical protein [Paraburkholderia aspalathi]MBK3780076.1 hypothetical protein [Paraburkholderia aspalathi]
MNQIPPFSPRIYDEPGIGRFYEDGRVLGAVDDWLAEGVRGLTISEWSSSFPGQGHTKQALRWLRSEGFQRIVANGVGLIEDGVGDIATSYWLLMHSQGLVDVLLDDDSQDITPAPAEVLAA